MKYVMLSYDRTSVINIEDTEDQTILHLLNGAKRLKKCPELLLDYKKTKGIEFCGGLIDHGLLFGSKVTEYSDGFILIDGKSKYRIEGEVCTRI